MDIQMHGQINIFYCQKQTGQMRIHLENKENEIVIKEKCFNTRGYYDPELPYDSAFLNAKVEAFQKYRERQTPLKVLDVLASNKQLKTQRNLILMHCKNNLVETTQKQTENIPFREKRKDFQKNNSKKLLPSVGQKRQKRVNVIWKNYLSRKQIVEDKENNKFRNMAALSTRINTEAISRKYTSCTSHSSVRQTINSHAKILKIFEDQETNRYE